MVAVLILTGVLSRSMAAGEVLAWPPLATFEMFLSRSTSPPEGHVWNLRRWTDECVACDRGPGAFCSNNCRR